MISQNKQQGVTSHNQHDAQNTKRYAAHTIKKYKDCFIHQKFNLLLSENVP